MSERQPFVYFIAPIGGGPIKIGVSHRPKTRLRELNQSSPYPLEIVALVPGGVYDERSLHGAFVAHWSHREWFKPASEILALIEEVKLNGKIPERYLADGWLRNPIPDRVRVLWSAERRASYAEKMRAFHIRNNRRFALATEFGVRGSKNPYGDADIQLRREDAEKAPA